MFYFDIELTLLIGSFGLVLAQEPFKSEVVRKNEALIFEKFGWSILDEPQTFKNR